MVLFGRNPISEAIEAQATIEKIYIKSMDMQGSVQKIIGQAKQMGIPIVEVPKKKLDQMTQGQNHQGIVAEVNDFSYTSIDQVLTHCQEKNHPPFLLMLDHMQDPYNLGAIIRTSVCMGVDAIIIPSRRAAGVNATVEKVSVGATNYIPIVQVVNLAQTLEELKASNIWAYALDMQGQPAAGVNYDGGKVFIIGNEGKGVSKLLLDRVDVTVRIPMVGPIQSLNASVAAGMILYEVTRLREGK